MEVKDAPQIRSEILEKLEQRIKEEATQANIQFSPAQYAGMSIENENGRIYTINPDLTVSGRNKIEAAKIELIAGINPRHIDLIKLCTDKRENFNKAIQIYGQRLTPRLYLAFTLTEEFTKERGLNGILSTTPIKKIYSINP